ncbi:CAPS, partial [Symbiodinium sp. KB8]
VFPADDTVQIYETAARNSGIVAGKFLSRRQLLKPSGEPWVATDFPIGAEVELSAHRFRIVDIDEFTKVRVPELDDNSASGKGSISKELRALLDRLKEVLLYDNNVHGIHGLAVLFRRMDRNSDNTLDKRELRAGICELSGGRLDLTDEELQLLVDAFDVNRSGRVDFDELLDGLRGRLPQRRRALVSAALAKLNTRNDGRIQARDLIDVSCIVPHFLHYNRLTVLHFSPSFPLSFPPSLCQRFNFEAYEPVQRGFMSVETAKKDLLLQFNLDAPVGIITSQDFIDYHRDISAKYDKDEDFEAYVRGVWRL